MLRTSAGALVLFFLGCTHRGQLSADGAELAAGQVVSAQTVSGAEVEGVVVKGPLGGYRIRLAQPRRELELGELRTVSRQSAARGALDGLLIGGAVGLLAGVLLGAAQDEPGYVAKTRGEAMLLGAAMVGGAGVVVGAAGGAVGGATYEYAMPAR